MRRDFSWGKSGITLPAPRQSSDGSRAADRSTAATS